MPPMSIKSLFEENREKMYEYEYENTRKCIIDHPGFTDVCLNEFVLDTASLGLKTKSHRNYASVCRECQKTRSELLTLRCSGVDIFAGHFFHIVDTASDLGRHTKPFQ